MFEYFKDPANIVNAYRILVFIFLLLMGFCEYKAWEKSEEINKSYKSKANFDRECIKQGVDYQKKKIDEINPKLDSVITKFIEQNKDLANAKSNSLRLLAFAKYKDKDYIDALQLIDKAMGLDASDNKNLLVRAYICSELYDMFGCGASADSQITVDKFYDIAKNDLASIMNNLKGKSDIYIEAFVRLQYLNSIKASMMYTDNKVEANKIYDDALEAIKKAQIDFPDNMKLKMFYKIITDSRKLCNEVDRLIEVE